MKLFWLLMSLSSVWSAAVFRAGVHSNTFEKSTSTVLNSTDSFLLILGLKSPNAHEAQLLIEQISDPTHAKYGQHLTAKQADQLLSADPNSIPLIKQWLQRVNPQQQLMMEHCQASNTIRVLLTIEQIEQLLHTKLAWFKTKKGSGNKRQLLVRASRPIRLPKHIDELTTFFNINSYPIGLRPLSTTVTTTTTSSSTKKTSMNPTKLRKLYNIPSDMYVRNPANIQSVPEFYEESYSLDDLKQFLHKYKLPLPFALHNQNLNRTNDPQFVGSEASLDVQYITALAPNASTTVWLVNGSNPFSSIDEPFLRWARFVLKSPNPALVHSLSYSDDEEHVLTASKAYVEHFDNLLMKMATRGMSVLFASGDDGVAGQRPSILHLKSNKRCARHSPQWPSGSPYVTSIGATMFLPSSSEGIDSYFQTREEVVCSSSHGGVITSGGGFSNHYAQPKYQQQQVQAYLRTKDLPQSVNFFNRTGRGYPDVAAFGVEYEVVMNKQIHLVSGTSASTPVWAALLTLVNEGLLQQNRSPLGFVNPLLYHLATLNASVFQDIVIGNNGASAGNAYTCSESFHAAKGWDPTTGLGTPNFRVMYDLIVNHPSLIQNHSPEKTTETSAPGLNKKHRSTTPSPPPIVTAAGHNTSTTSSGKHGARESSDSSSGIVIVVMIVIGGLFLVGIMGLVVKKKLISSYGLIGTAESNSKSTNDSINSSTQAMNNFAIGEESDEENDFPSDEEEEDVKLDSI